jgi:hypothetical protein
MPIWTVSRLRQTAIRPGLRAGLMRSIVTQRCDILGAAPAGMAVGGMAARGQGMAAPPAEMPAMSPGKGK